MNIGVSWFDNEVMPRLDGYSTVRSSFRGGEFGDLERLEIEADSKMGTIELWSEGWVSFDIFDLTIEEQTLNRLLSPDEAELIPNILREFFAGMIVST